ncbi:MAG TPA: tyrosine-protein phosphatase [Tepidisphaeraceae bacterium]
MSRSFAIFLFVTIFELCGGGCVPPTVGRSFDGLSNFAVVSESPRVILRGGQPTPEGIARLAKDDLKVATVIDLRADAEYWEANAVRAQGMTYTRIGTRATKIDQDQIREFLNTVTSAKAPVYVHCREGRDRTGLEIAMYRMVVERWTKEAAIADLREHGYNRFWFPGIERFLVSVNPDQFRSSLVQKGSQ